MLRKNRRSLPEYENEDEDDDSEGDEGDTLDEDLCEYFTPSELFPQKAATIAVIPLRPGRDQFRPSGCASL